MTAPEVRRLAPQERDRALATVVAAFWPDPLLRWWFPDDAGYPDQAARFFGALLDLRSAGGEVWGADGTAAVAMWTPPGGLLLDPDLAAATFAAVNAGLPGPVVERLVRVEDAVHRALPEHPHWYLGVLATDPDRRGQGLASAVLGPVLAHADRAGLEVWLETASERNLRFYARHGFAATQQVCVDDAPTVHVLRRLPADR